MEDITYLMSINIRFAKVEDFEAVRKFDPHSEYIPSSRIKNKLNQKELIIAEENNNIIGILKFSYFWATRPYIDLIWILPRNRDQKLGTRMLDFLEDFLTSEGHSFLHSSFEEGDNKALSWHKAKGFIECGFNSALNLPHEKVKEIFLYKPLKNSKNKDDLDKYQLL